MGSIIQPDQTWVLWTFLVGWAAISIYLENRYSWAKKVTGAIIALLGALVATNLHIIPMDSPVYDAVWGYVVPLAIPMLMFQANMRRIFQESGRLLALFMISAAGTVIGAILAYYTLADYIPGLKGVAAIMTGSYIGGGVNFVALSSAFHVPGELISAATVADNLIMALYFFVLLAIASIAFFLKNFNHPLIDEVERQGGAAKIDQTIIADSKKRNISIFDLAANFGLSLLIIAISQFVANFFSEAIPTTNWALSLANALLGNMYLVLTTLTMIMATVFAKFFENLAGSTEIGTFLIYIFLVVIGVPASIAMIIDTAPLLLVFCAIMVAVNMVVTFTGAKLFHFNLEEAIIASNVAIGGPATGSAMAISKGWTALVGPSIFVGICGYIIGNYLGIIVGSIL